MSKVLILAPHTDDGEFGCGGTIARLIEESNEVYYVAFSICRESVPNGLPEDTLKNELYDAMRAFGIEDKRVRVLDYPVRVFPAHRQEILEDMIMIRKEIEPDMVFAPSIYDIHQDHHVIAEEARRAFKNVTIFGYEVPWNNFSFANQGFFKLEKRHLDKKRQAIECYKSQFGRKYSSEKFTLSQARVHGMQIGCEYAEVFEVARYVV